MFKLILKNGGIVMAKPIGDTPELVGKEAEDFLNSLNRPLTKKDKEFKKRLENVRKVPF